MPGVRSLLNIDMSTADSTPDRQDPSQLSLSDKGLDFIERHEVLREKVYQDSAGNPTIGYGHRIWPSEAEDFRQPIDKDTARQLLSMDVELAEQAVRRHAKDVPLTQNEYDALVSFVFNVGGGQKGFAGSSVLGQLKAGDYRAAAEEMSKWVHITKDGKPALVPGLVSRRNDEQSLFRDGKY